MESEKNTEIVWYQNVSYEEKIELAKEKLTNMVGSFVEAGYWIRSIWEDEECGKHGYATIWDMAEAEFGLKKSEASRAINMNKKYSVGGNSPIILDKYSFYSKSQLQEMLTIKNEELEQKVTADMTVEEIRQLKKEWRSWEEEKEPAEPVNTESDRNLGTEPLTEAVATSQEPVNTESDELLEIEIIEEIEAEEEEIVEYLEFEKLDDGEGGEKEEITIIDGEFREIPMVEEQSYEIDLPEFEDIQVAAVENSKLNQTKKILEKEVQEQPELAILKNNDQRQEFIAGYREWPLWIEQPLTGERYYRYEFGNGTAFVIRVYFHKCFDITASYNKKWEDRYKDDWGAEEYYIVTEGKHFKDCLTNKSQMIEFLKNLQKGEK